MRKTIYREYISEGFCGPKNFNRILKRLKAQEINHQFPYNYTYQIPTYNIRLKYSVTKDFEEFTITLEGRKTEISKIVITYLCKANQS